MIVCGFSGIADIVGVVDMPSVRLASSRAALGSNGAGSGDRVAGETCCVGMVTGSTGRDGSGGATGSNAVRDASSLVVAEPLGAS